MRNELKEHIDKTIGIAKSFGNYLLLSKEDFNTLVLATTYHDIGKMYISQEILYKNDKLNAEEFEEIKKHPYFSYLALLNMGERNLNILNAVKQHHERIDGTGYPCKLKGNEISGISKIISIIDSYEAMTGKRCYKNSLTKNEAIEEIRNGFNAQFDKELGLKFIDFIQKNDAFT